MTTTSTRPPVITSPRGSKPPLITTMDDLIDIADQLDSSPIAIDTERANGVLYSSHVELIQCRQNSVGSFLIDAQALSSDQWEIFAQRLTDIPWIVHAAAQDLMSLARLGIICHNLFDTELAGRFLGFHQVNLAALTREFLNLDLTKGMGRSQWELRPFTPELLNYAALDVELLLELRDRLAGELLDAQKLSWFEEECQYILASSNVKMRKFSGRKIAGFYDLLAAQKHTVEMLWNAREKLAHSIDCASHLLCSDNNLIEWVKKLPDHSALNDQIAPEAKKLVAIFDQILHNPIPENTGHKTAVLDRNSALRSEIVELISAVAKHYQLDPIILSFKALTGKITQLLSEESILSEDTLGIALQEVGARSWQRNLLLPALMEKFC